MKHKYIIFIIFISFILFFTGCQNKPAKEEIGQYIKENPNLILEILKDHPQEIFEIAQTGQQIKSNRALAERRDKELKNPITFHNQQSRFFKPGATVDAPVQIVLFSNFQCPFCKKSAQLIDQISESYPGKVNILFRHLSSDSLSFQQALLFETVGLENPEKAWKLHDFMFNNQKEIRKDQSILKQELKKMGLELTSKDIENPKALSHLQSDNEEAQRLHINRTPTLFVNGITITGQDFLKDMVGIIEKSL